LSVPYEQVRCSAADREAVVERLRRALSQGRLTVDEFEERAMAAAQASTHGDLAALTRDLPGSLW
jgi:hypothetical protein